MKVKGDTLFALALFAVFSFGTYQSLVMEDPAGGPHDVGAAFFPFWVCVFIQVLTVTVFVQTLGRGPAEAEDGMPVRRRVLLLAGILVLLFAYIVVMETVGFVASSTAFMVLVHQLLVFSGTGKVSPPKALGVSVLFFAVTSGALFFIFNTVFSLALP